ncbi:MAG: nucleoside recognition domain-containing protein [Anaerotignaceae bacterium]
MRSKKIALTIVVFTCFVFFIIYPSPLIKSANKSLCLWYTGVLPTLFPFAVGINILTEIGFAQAIGEKLNFFVGKLFRVNGCGGFALIMGLLAGYPAGAKVTADLYEKKLITVNEAQCILSFCNNAGPIFITVTAGSLLLKSKEIGYVLLLSTILSNIICGIFIGHLNKKPVLYTNRLLAMRKNKPQPIGALLGNSISSAANTLVVIGGYIVLFGILVKILYITHILSSNASITTSLVAGLLEMTTGISTLSSAPLNMFTKTILASFILSFGGASIQLQITGILQDVPINMPVYYATQIFNALLSAIISAIIFTLIF